MPAWVQTLLTIIGSVLASSGFWAFISAKRDAKSAQTKALMGLLHDKVMTKGQEFINDGEIDLDSYNDYFKYFYDPYKALGGNGTGERMADEIRRLPIKK